MQQTLHLMPKTLDTLIACIDLDDEQREMVMEAQVAFAGNRFIRPLLDKLAAALDSLGRADASLRKCQANGIELLPDEFDGVVRWRNEVYESLIYPLTDRLKRQHG